MYDVVLKKLFVSTITRNATISPSEKIISPQIVTNENDSHVVNSNPLFQLFLTELFDSLNELVEKMLQQLDIVPEPKSDGINSEKVSMFLTKRN